MPAINKLTDTQCRKAEPREKPYKLFDGNGLHLLITPAGSKVWRQAYRRPQDGKQDTLAHGPYPLITLQQVREKRDDALRLLLEGQDPKKAAKAATAPAASQKCITLQEASDRYWDGRQDLSEGYLANAKRGIELHLSTLLKRDMRSVTHDEFLQEMNVMNAAGKFVYLRKVRMWASQVWHWAVAQKYADQNIPDLIDTRRGFGSRPVQNFASLHPEREFPKFWRRVGYEDELLSVLAAEMIAYTWGRTKEVRFMEWTEIDAFSGLFSAGRRGMVPDVDREWLWEIPEGKMKRRRAHVVPMPRRARELLLKLWARSKGSKYVFPAEHRLDRTISENTVLELIERIGYKGLMTGHGFRSVASTWGNERGYNKDWIELQLSHAEGNKARGAYNKAEYLEGRRKMLQDFADWLDSHRKENAANGGIALVAA